MHWLQTLDAGLFRFINQSLSNPFFDAVMPWFSGNRLFLPLVILAGVIFIWRGKVRALVCVLMLVAVVPLGDSLVVNNLKKVIGRPRPFNAIPETRSLVGRSGSAGMPSAHSANWFAAAALLYLYSRRSAKFMLPPAVTVAFSRVYNGVHYPGDVFVGAIVGAGCGLASAIALETAWRRVGRKWFPLWLEKMPSLLFARPAVAPTRSATSDPQSEINRHWLRAGYLLVAVLTLARWMYVASGAIELSQDEAYQWVWSKHLDLSYYSKPPLIAYTQFLGTSLWGDNAFGVRFFSPLIGGVLGFLMLRFFAREVSGRAGFFFTLMVTATPLLSVGATLMTVDPLSVLFWTAAMLAGWRAIQENSTVGPWLWVGLWMGLGFLSKYTALFQWLCWAVFFVLWPPARRHLRRPGPYLALGINLLCTLPVIVWNYQRQWITVTHVADRAVGKPWELTTRFLVEFLGAEFALLNPVFFTGMVIALIAMWRRPSRDLRLVYFFSMGAPLFLCYLGFSVHGRTLPNWIAPAVLPMFSVMVIYWDARQREGARLVKPFLTAGLVLGLLFVGFLHDTNVVQKIAGRALPPKPDPLTRVRAHAELARVVNEARTKLLTEGKPVFIIGAHYGITSLLNFYIPEARASVKTNQLAFCPPSEKPQNQYYFWPGYQGSRRGENALYVRETAAPKLVPGWISKWLAGETNLLREPAESVSAPDALVHQFDSVTNLGLREVLYRGRVFHTIQIFECRSLQ